MSKHIDEALSKLRRAVEGGKSDGYCLRLWSAFTRVRDHQRCVLCYRTNGLAAHHIVRKSFLAIARFSPGNGITLCRRCHAEPHEAFNRRPDMMQPMDAQGGEKIDLMMGFYGALAEDALKLKQQRLDYYFLSDEVLGVFKRFQELPESAKFPGLPVEQAYWIWRQTPRSPLFAILKANGLSLPPDFIQLPGVTVIG